eukprot:jgi/Mesvir1/16734/Mv25528-RA.1
MFITESIRRRDERGDWWEARRDSAQDLYHAHGARERHRHTSRESRQQEELRESRRRETRQAPFHPRDNHGPLDRVEHTGSASDLTGAAAGPGQPGRARERERSPVRDANDRPLRQQGPRGPYPRARTRAASTGPSSPACTSAASTCPGPLRRDAGTGDRSATGRDTGPGMGIRGTYARNRVIVPLHPVAGFVVDIDVGYPRPSLPPPSGFYYPASLRFRRGSSVLIQREGTFDSVSFLLHAHVPAPVPSESRYEPVIVGTTATYDLHPPPLPQYRAEHHLRRIAYPKLMPIPGAIYMRKQLPEIAAAPGFNCESEKAQRELLLMAAGYFAETGCGEVDVEQGFIRFTRLPYMAAFLSYWPLDVWIEKSTLRQQTRNDYQVAFNADVVAAPLGKIPEIMTEHGYNALRRHRAQQGFQ